MASSVIGALRVNLGLDTAAWNKGLNTATAGMGKFKQRMLIAAAGMASALAGAFAVAMKGAINLADEMGKMAQKVGVPIEELSALRYAAQLADVDLATLGTSLGRLSRNMAQAAEGGKAATAAFAGVGVAFQNADGTLRPTEEVLADIADRFAAMPDGAAKTAAAMELMGRGGAAMIPLLNDGSAALRELREEAARLGVIISQETADASEEFNDGLTRLKAAAQGLALTLTARLAPTLAQIADGYVLLANNIRNVGAIASEIFGNMVHLAKTAGYALAAVALYIQGKFVEAFAVITSTAASAFEYIANAAPDFMHLELGAAAVRGVADQLTAEAQAHTDAAKALYAEAQAESNKGNKALTTIIQPAKVATAAVGDLGDEIDDLGTSAGGGGAAKGVDELAKSLEELKAEAESVFEETRTPQEQFAAQITKINGLFRAGLIDLDTYNRAVVLAQDELKDFGTEGETAFETAGQGFADMLAGMLSGTETFADALKSILNSVASNLIQSGINTLFAGLKIPGFAGGTNFAPGGLARLNELGGEIINLPRGSQVIPHDLSRNMVRQPSQVAVHVTTGVNVEGGNIRPYIEDVAMRTSGQAIGSYDQALPSRISRMASRPYRK